MTDQSDKPTLGPWVAVAFFLFMVVWSALAWIGVYHLFLEARP